MKFDSKDATRSSTLSEYRYTLSLWNNFNRYYYKTDKILSNIEHWESEQGACINLVSSRRPICQQWNRQRRRFSLRLLVWQPFNSILCSLPKTYRGTRSGSQQSRIWTSAFRLFCLSSQILIILECIFKSVSGSRLPDLLLQWRACGGHQLPQHQFIILCSSWQP